MKFRYDKEDDVMMVWLSQAKVGYAEKARNIVTHFSKTGKPVLLEILQATKFLEQANRQIPFRLRQTFATV